MSAAVMIEVETVVGAVADFGQASAELIAWELAVSVAELLPAWVEACERGLLARTGQVDAEFPDEITYGATAAGLLSIEREAFALAC